MSVVVFDGNCSLVATMPRYRGKNARQWWRDSMFSPPFSGAGKWKNTWSEKRRKKRAAWQAAFDYLPDLDDRYDMLSGALPLIGFSGHGAAPLARNNGKCILCYFCWKMVLLRIYQVGQ